MRSSNVISQNGFKCVIVKQNVYLKCSSIAKITLLIVNILLIFRLACPEQYD